MPGTGSARKKAFTPEFMKQFEAEHNAAYPEGNVALDSGGNPDGGNGWYSQKLDLKSWF